MDELHPKLRPYRNAGTLIVGLNQSFTYTRRVLKEYFENLHLHEIGDEERPLSYSLFRSMVHALADERLDARGARFIQALLLKFPEKVFPTLLGALATSHKESRTGAQRRVDIVKKLLKRRAFATTKNLDSLLHNLKEPERAEHIAEVLTHPTYVSQAPLLGKLVNELSILTSHPGYVPVIAENILLDLMDRPEAARHLEEIVRTRNADVLFNGERKWWAIHPDDILPLRAILSTGIRSWANRTVANSALFRLEDPLHGVASQRILAHPHFIENPHLRRVIIHRLLYNVSHANPVKAYNSVALLQTLAKREDVQKEVERVLTDKKVTLVKYRWDEDRPLDETQLERIREHLE